jgi:hypothetical protein
MKKTCEIIILGCPFSVVRTEVEGGENMMSEEGSFIKINKNYDDKTFLKFIHHELHEIVLNMMGLNYNCCNPNHKKEMFVFNHNDMNISDDVVWAAYEEIRKSMACK